MKFNNHIMSFFFYAFNGIFHSKGMTTVSQKDLDNFYYGRSEFTLAVIGDSGTEREAKSVMELSNFNALLHLGDFDYNCQADKYFNNILDYNRQYQFMGVIGNHDARSECGDSVAKSFLNNVYNEMTSSRNKETSCEFSQSRFMWSCVYKNIRIVGLTPSISGADSRSEQLYFLKKHLRDATEDWKICAWHFYDKYYHTGKYQEYGNIVSGDDGGESFYDICKEQGAIIFSAHDHVYARTRVMSKFSSPIIDVYDSKTGSDIVQIRKGATFNILNGAGGWEMYIEQGEQKDYSHWQKKYAKGNNNENAKRYGGLFCKFNVGGNNRKAYCEFQRINSSEKVFDHFYIYRNDEPSNRTYIQIDEDFSYEKLNAYKAKYNIQDGNNNIQNHNNDVNDNNNNNYNDENNNSNYYYNNTSNESYNNNLSPITDINGFQENVKNQIEEKTSLLGKIFSEKSMVIVGICCSLIILFVGGLTVYKKNIRKHKEKKEEDIIMEENFHYFY